MNPGPGRHRRLLLPLVSLVVAFLSVLVVEGGMSLFARRSLRPAAPFVNMAKLMQKDAQREPGATFARTRGLRVHRDPRVSYVLRHDEAPRSPDSNWSVDWLGVRTRPGGKAPANALRVAVLGDSVAFSEGVKNHETIAAQLERILNDIRSPDDPPVACFTVATPSWTTLNAVHFLLDYFHTIDPDIVIYLPVSNDLTDSGGVHHSGERRVAFDAMAEDPLLLVANSPHIFYEFVFGQRVRSGELIAEIEADEIGVFALNSDLSRESSRRYDQTAEAIIELERVLAGAGRRLMLLFHREQEQANEGYHWVLRERLLDRGASIPVVRGLRELEPWLRVKASDQLHPNAKCCFGLASWCAERLVELGWVTTGGEPLPTLPEMLPLRVPVRTEAEIRDRAEQFRDTLRDALQETINTETARGARQIYGGLNPDGSMGARLLAMLKPTGPELRVTLGPLADDLIYGPVHVTVEINRKHVGTITVQPGDPTAVTTSTFPLPQRSDPSLPIEVRLTPDNFTMHGFSGMEFVASCRLIELSCAPR
jgi:hypothetical protein